MVGDPARIDKLQTPAISSHMLRGTLHADQESIRRQCVELIEERLHDIEAGKEKTMFEPWRGRLHTTGLGS